MVLLGLGLGGGVLNQVINPSEMLDSEARIFEFLFFVFLILLGMSLSKTKYMEPLLMM